MNSNDFKQVSERIVYNYIVEHLDNISNYNITLDNVHTMWSCKTLQNNKALISTDLQNDMYYEVTLNGDKNEIYLDAYKKFENRCCKVLKAN